MQTNSRDERRMLADISHVARHQRRTADALVVIAACLMSETKALEGHPLPNVTQALARLREGAE
jgi:hypothetical protein